MQATKFYMDYTDINSWKLLFATWICQILSQDILKDSLFIINVIAGLSLIVYNVVGIVQRIKKNKKD